MVGVVAGVSVGVDPHDLSEAVDVNSSVAGSEVLHLGVNLVVVEVGSDRSVEVLELVTVEVSVSVGVKLSEKMLDVGGLASVSVSDLLAGGVHVSQELLSADAAVSVGVESGPLSVELLGGEVHSCLSVHLSELVLVDAARAVVVKSVPKLLLGAHDL